MKLPFFNELLASFNFGATTKDLPAKGQFFTEKSHIKEWLKEHGIEKYKLVADPKYKFVVDVMQDVSLNGRNLSFIPVKFNKVEGDFYCNNNRLKSLKFAPQTVTGGFWCSHNRFMSLEHSPLKIGGDFSCSNNKITSLAGCPQHIGNNFYCYANQITSLIYFPEVVIGKVSCGENPELGDWQDISDFKTLYQEYIKANLTKNTPS